MSGWEILFAIVTWILGHWFIYKITREFFD